MKPLNHHEIRRAKLSFLLNFIILLVVTMACIGLLEIMASKEITFLQKRKERFYKIEQVQNNLNTEMSKIVNDFHNLPLQEGNYLGWQTLTESIYHSRNNLLANLHNANADTSMYSYQYYNKVANAINVILDQKSKVQSSRSENRNIQDRISEYSQRIAELEKILQQRH